MKRTMIWSSIALLGISSGVFFLSRNSRAATPTPEYELVKKQGRFEVRRYPDLTLATTPMRAQEKGMNGAFGRLFRFITGQNQTGQKISMTTPVFMKGERSHGTMSFILPKEMDPRNAPAPANSEVTIQRTQGGLFAVYRFSGSWSEERASESRKKLTDWLGTSGLKEAEPREEIVAYYDPPWTPPFMRRNEVLVRLAKS